jgi:hypothetical protein
MRWFGDNLVLLDLGDEGSASPAGCAGGGCYGWSTLLVIKNTPG